MKVAIIQNRFQKGGRLRVNIEITKLLNQNGITPDWIAAKSNVSTKDIALMYDKDIQFSFRLFKRDLKLPFEWHILWFNYKMKKYVDQYDLIINSNNTSFLLPDSSNVISYTHFPRKYRNISKTPDIHRPEIKKKKLLDIKSDPFRIAEFFYKAFDNKKRSEKVIANSLFTREKIKEVYSIDKVDVIYPPTDISIRDFNKGSAKQILSLGRFSPEKRQLEVIQLAQKLPDITFNIAGFVNDGNYYRRCGEELKKLQLANVNLLGDIPKEEVRELQKKCAFFLHLTRNEPFGLTSLEAIQNGMIPVVHASGGQQEVVVGKDLQFLNAEEAKKRLEDLSNLGIESLEKLYSTLIQNAQQFSSESFAQKMNQLLTSYLDK